MFGYISDFKMHKLNFKHCFIEPVIVDYDNDGDKDILISDEDCNVYLLENLLINFGEMK
jgi:hypothetical protein